MMPTRYRSSVESRPGNEDTIRLEGLLATDSGGGVAGDQIGPANDFDPRHELLTWMCY
jgi:hypothetical protein